MRLFSILILTLLLTFQTPPLFSESDYKFLDENGNEIELKLPDEIYDSQNLGPWKSDVEHLHHAKINSHIRRDGLEHVRILTVDVSQHPTQDKELGFIDKIYIVDKDGLLIGYKSFSLLRKKAVFKAKINGIINYIKIYVICSEHGAWMTQYQL